MLADRQMFPGSLQASEIEESASLEDIKYADALMKLDRLYKKCHELDLKVRIED